MKGGSSDSPGIPDKAEKTRYPQSPFGGRKKKRESERLRKTEQRKTQRYTEKKKDRGTHRNKELNEKTERKKGIQTERKEGGRKEGSRRKAVYFQALTMQSTTGVR